ncbi:IS30 family transposase [Arthrobacter sp. W4I7]|nr:IS30 family transposase [Arthrobacter sp. W4I7]
MPALTGKPRRKYTQGEKDRFFEVLARGGTVTSVAAELGLGRMACYQWTRAAGVRFRKQEASQEEKDAFFALFGRLGNASDAAAQLGLNRNTCYKWIRNAGLARKRADQPSREDFRQLREAGHSRREAARVLGIHPTTAGEWDAGVRKTGSGRIYPDGRVVDYKQGVTTFETPSGRMGPVRPGLATLEKAIDPRYLSLQERESIRDLLAAGDSLRVIGIKLGRSASSISREIGRNSSPGAGYQPYAAQRSAASRRPRPKESKLAAEGRLRAYVEEKLRIRWSPEQISHALIKEFPNDPHMRVSSETIYQGLYVQARGGLRREIQAALRTGRTRRKAHNTGEQRISRFADPMVNISERPPEIEDRAVPGHWEGDLITGAYNQSAIATLVERTTRYVMLVHLPGNHTAETVGNGLVKTMSSLPAHLRGSLTWDQGAEMAAHKSFSMSTDMAVYFCDPASPWQRGTNENTNGLLRQYFPKGTDLSVYGPEDLEHVAQELNARPRKTLGWDTPAERLRDLLVTH